MDALVGERGIVYDARGLVEPDDTVPGVSEIDGTTAVFDAKDLTHPQDQPRAAPPRSTSAASRT